MRLLRLTDVTLEETDVVFRTSGLASLIAGIVMWPLVGAAVWVAVYGRIGSEEIPRWVGIWVAIFAFLFALLVTSAFRASRRTSNWIMRVRGSSVLIKFRSYQNWKMSEEDVQVVELSRDEIEFVRQRKERQVSRDSENSTVVERKVELEMGVNGGDTSELEAAIREEMGRPGAGNDWHRSKSLDYPVQAKDGIIQIMWKSKTGKVTPGIKVALAAMGELAPIREDVGGVQDFSDTTIKALPDEEKEKRLAELARRDMMAATMTTQKVYGCSLTEAKDRVEKMLGEVQRQP